VLHRRERQACAGEENHASPGEPDPRHRPTPRNVVFPAIIGLFPVDCWSLNRARDNCPLRALASFLRRVGAAAAQRIASWGSPWSISSDSAPVPA
jgi:hypothetical protein